MLYTINPPISLHTYSLDKTYL